MESTCSLHDQSRDQCTEFQGRLHEAFGHLFLCLGPCPEPGKGVVRCGPEHLKGKLEDAAEPYLSGVEVQLGQMIAGQAGELVLLFEREEGVLFEEFLYSAHINSLIIVLTRQRCNRPQPWLSLLQGEGRGEDESEDRSTKPIPTLILPLKGRRLTHHRTGLSD